MILIVEDEPVARMLYLSMVARMRDVSAVAAATVAEARSLIRAAPPQLVILDMKLPDGSGLEVLAALDAQQVNASLIVITAHLQEWEARLAARSRVQMLNKPVPVGELRQLIDQTVHEVVPSGPFAPLDYVQLACMGQHSAVIECTGAQARGEIVVQKGQLWSARDKEGSGAEAFQRLALAKGGRVRVLPERQPPGRRNIEERWELLILEAIRTADEATRSVTAKVAAEVTNKEVPSAAAAPAAVVPKAAVAPAAMAPAAVAPAQEAPSAAAAAVAPPADFNSCVDRALRAVVARDFATARSELERALALRPNDALVRHRLERLRLLRAREEKE